MKQRSTMLACSLLAAFAAASVAEAQQAQTQLWAHHRAIKIKPGKRAEFDHPSEESHRPRRPPGRQGRAAIHGESAATPAGRPPPDASPREDRSTAPG